MVKLLIHPTNFNNSFFADVGGYMGMLLGFSIQSLFEMAEGALKAMTKRI